MSDEHDAAARREARGIGVNLLTLLAQVALPAFHVQLARRLGAGDYGLYAWSNAFVDTFSVITMFGMDLAVARRVSVAHAEGDAESAVNAVGGALRVVLLTGFVVSAGIALAAPWIAAWQHKPGLVTPLRMLVIVPIAYHATTVLITALQAKMAMRYDFWTRGLFQPLTLLALTTLALQLKPGLVGSCAAVALGMVLTAALATTFYAREWPLARTLRAALRQPVDRALLRAGLPVVVLGLVWGVQGTIDTFFLGRYGSSEDVAAYRACAIYVVSLSQVRGAFYPVICATLPPMLARGDTVAINAFIQRQTRWVAMLAMPLCVLFAGFGDGLLAVFGPAFVRGAPALALLAIGHLSGALALPAYTLLLGGKARFSTMAGAVCLVFQLVALPLWVPVYGLTGAALSAATGLVLSQVVQLGFAFKINRVHGFSMGLAKVVAASLAGLVVGRGLFQWTETTLVLRFISGVTVAALVYVSVLVALGLRDDERQMVREASARIRGRLRRTV